MSNLSDRKQKRFKFQLKFMGGTLSQPFIIEAFDATGATGKLTGIISDQPKEVVGVIMEKEQGVDAIIKVPAGFKLPPPRIQAG